MLKGIQSSFAVAMAWDKEMSDLGRTEGVEKAKQAWPLIQKFRAALVDAAKQQQKTPQGDSGGSFVVFPMQIPPSNESDELHQVRLN